MSGRSPTFAIIARAAASPRCAVAAVLIASGSSSIAPTVLRGLSEPYGFWNTICTDRSSSAFGRVHPLVGPPSISRSPAVGGSISVAMRARVDLPQPDSPTTPASSGVQCERHTIDRAHGGLARKQAGVGKVIAA